MKGIEIPDLHGSMPRPPIRMQAGFVSDPAGLLRQLDALVTWDERMHSRRTASFGAPYNYSQISYPRVEMPSELELICAAIERAVGFRPNNCLLNEYRSGEATMGFHSDEVDQLEPGTGIAIVSLGAMRPILFRLKHERSVTCSIALSGGSLLFMPAEMQREWHHAIPAAPGTGRRVSLTFRRLS